MPPKLGFIQWPQNWAFYNTKKFKFKKYIGFIVDGLAFLDFLAMSSLMRSSSYLPPILFVHIYMMEPLVHACMHALVGLETLKVWVWSNVQAM